MGVIIYSFNLNILSKMSYGVLECDIVMLHAYDFVIKDFVRKGIICAGSHYIYDPPYIYTYICIYICIYVYICIYMYICVYMCIYMYIYTHTHTYTHVQYIQSLYINIYK